MKKVNVSESMHHTALCPGNKSSSNFPSFFVTRELHNLTLSMKGSLNVLCFELWKNIPQTYSKYLGGDKIWEYMQEK